MLLTKKSANCVVVGAFNIFIFSPDWIADLFDLGDPDGISLDVDLNSPGYKMSSGLLPFQWFVRPDRLGFECLGAESRFCDYAVRILERLPETPVRAVGHNFTYTIAKKSLSPETRSHLDAISLKAEGLDKIGSTIRWKAFDVRFSVELIVQPQKEEVTTVVNVHADVLKDTDLACQVLSSHQTYRDAAEAMVLQTWTV